MTYPKIFAFSAIMAIIAWSNTSIAMENVENPDIVDIRVFGLEFPHNRQDELGNTFWHNLALGSEISVDWSEMNQKMNNFKQNNKNWLPNPFILNNNGKTARQVAKDAFNQSGNPISGLLAFVYLKQQEDSFLNQMALKASREATAHAQQFPHPNG
jgi:hypothetical protein